MSRHRQIPGPPSGDGAAHRVIVRIESPDGHGFTVPVADDYRVTVLHPVQALADDLAAATSDGWETLLHGALLQRAVVVHDITPAQRDSLAQHLDRPADWFGRPDAGTCSIMIDASDRSCGSPAGLSVALAHLDDLGLAYTDLRALHHQADPPPATASTGHCNR